MPTLASMAEAVGALLKARSDTIAVSESSTGPGLAGSWACPSVDRAPIIVYTILIQPDVSTA